jgi:hypothetical protein
MAQTADWRIDLMKAHPRLFPIMPDEPTRSLGYPLCEAGWRDVLVRLCNRIENAPAVRRNISVRPHQAEIRYRAYRFRWRDVGRDQTQDQRGHRQGRRALGLHLRNLRSAGAPLQPPRLACDTLRGAHSRRSGAG